MKMKKEVLCLFKVVKKDPDLGYGRSQKNRYLLGDFRLYDYLFKIFIFQGGLQKIVKYNNTRQNNNNHECIKPVQRYEYHMRLSHSLSTAALHKFIPSTAVSICSAFPSLPVIKSSSMELIPLLLHNFHFDQKYQWNQFIHSSPTRLLKDHFHRFISQQKGSFSSLYMI